ncbi:MAG TPA: ADP-ribosylglycohydrolase family protein [Blastocatellia bacterium]|nr:ADP-ribosylglycohydrolase family protein [Blastocatellia bacterium]HMZ19698.1 ADP-ribosylglycohydrolase family protein [Blastocatellia bacterium]HNG29524.1 ADP-ribosylglycohydrolase family protein [Blastocatellia bacterium]
MQDRISGCILGGAIGDALGGPFEGRQPPIQFDDTANWRLSDDTQLTLATCEAIIERRGRIDPAAIAARFADWHRTRRVTRMGASTLKALTELAVGGHWALVGRKGERAAGNGAAMRIAPLAFCLDPAAPETRRTIRDVSRITHHHEEAYAGALAVVVAVRAAAQNNLENLPALVAAALPDTEVRDRLNALAEMSLTASLFEIAERFGCSGYVCESVPLALCAASRIERLGFQPMLAELVCCGGDTDTIASIAGQVAGAFLGETCLPKEWLLRLPERDFIKTAAARFAESLAV